MSWVGVHVSQIEVKMVVGLLCSMSKWQNANFLPYFTRNPAVFFDVLLIVQPGVAHPIDIRRRSPEMRTGRFGEPMGGGAISSVDAHQYRRSDAAAKVFQITRHEHDRARDVMREGVQQECGFPTIHGHQ